VVQVYDGKEKVVFYLSRRMLDMETRYLEIEKLCLCLFFTCTKLHHILLSAEVIVICKLDVIKHMLSAPVLKGQLGKWMFALSEFDIRYQPAKAVKGQALTDLIIIQNPWRIRRSCNYKSCSKLHLLTPRIFLDFSQFLAIFTELFLFQKCF
jgi:hypothetical protein